MGKITGFLEIGRQDRRNLPAGERLRHWREFTLPLSAETLKQQAARCMDCGIPYCHNGCPVNNLIPDWNDLVWADQWREALDNLHSTNNFPEFTGRLCPAPCEAACTLNINNDPVTIKSIECAIIDRGFREGWVKAQPPRQKNGKKIAIIGSGPAGLSGGQQLARQGYQVDIFEKNAKAGGLLRYGIPDFKMEKHLIDRRIAQMEEEGVRFHYHQNIQDATSMLKEYDAVMLACGAEHPRDLPIKGRDLKGVHFAMDFLTQQNRRNGGEAFGDEPISAKGKNVIVIGGGDTGSDCIGTSFRQGALSVRQLEIMPKPPEMEDKMLVWPDWPLKLRTSSSHEEGAKRDWSVMTKCFLGDGHNISHLDCVYVDENMKPINDKPLTLKADLVLLAMGFIHPIHQGLLNQLALELTQNGLIAANMVDYQSSVNKVFAAGDARRGQSLIVWAIKEGRQCAHAIDAFIMGGSELPR